MAYQTVSDQSGGLAQQHLTMYPHLEPETIIHDSDDSSVDPTLALGENRTGELDGRGGVVKRAMSTPDVRGLGVEGIALSAADKKRNKLGYHRTAVACGHCRRRKIRCIAAFEDSSGRCQNCIRLKKDCHFFPVDQTSLPVGRRARTASKADTSVAERDVSGSSSEQGGPPVLKSSPEEVDRSGANGLVPSPLSPHELTGFPNYGGSDGAFHDRSDARTDYIQPAERVGSSQAYGRPNTTLSTHLQVNPDMTRSQHQYFSPIATQFMASPLDASPQTSYLGSNQTSGNRSQWSFTGSSASASMLDSEESYHPYGAYRNHSHPSNFRRASEPQHSSFGYRDSYGYAQEAVSRQYHDPSMYSTGGYTSQTATSVPQLPVSASAGYGPAWHPNQGGLPYLREEDDQSHHYARIQP
ncbi:uncharacterized protein AB675_5966 [Cyphellophora attinorum]|uniref:Zn(2)-C6 fungal-type domain-containing protein n=1 Tax=Cyphellophora attinorum TaxID=1664694 RepID=A0A0N1NYM1_9EURO|nr:uncharacterized protein AB675_5966 [Phialophora attinorum]KPI36967.1 hypothetical protein AB675_5966 [Phialophora attinorum]